MTASRAIPCVLAAAAVALTACTAETGQRVQGESTASGQVGGGVPGPSGAPASTAPAVPALDAVSYRRELASSTEPVRDALKSLAEAKSRKSLRTRLAKTRDSLLTAEQRLRGILPPVEAQAAHTDYVNQLNALASGMRIVQGDLSSRTLCTAPSVMAALGSRGQIKTLDRAGEALAGTGDYPADVVTVKIPKRESRRLPHGRFIRSESRTGRSSLRIHNGSKYDAVVTAFRGKTKAFTVYVRKKKKLTVSGVRDGKYKIYYTRGVDWQSKVRAFGRSCSFELFGNSLKFKTRYTSTHVRWNNWTITLHAVKGGTVSTKSVDPEDYPD
ncbi:hypothetical protein [Sinosporangium siamense]|uniref:Lipoprotein n=1 Tax=Sinosporangium siamense TaxID=1367973 RepID=A0A919VD26_9ACTN|nr:hypothetical protein [Sinosporangium siamense]GII93709.1 hypothetical protein Ssi02_39400 [Sinosporangium siamense]